MLLNGILDTGATGTLMPLSTVNRCNLQEGVTWLNRENYLKVNGIGEGFIIGIHLAMPVTLGNRVERC